jgi:hypothetical protein
MFKKDRRPQLLKSVWEVPLYQLRSQQFGHVGDRRRPILWQLTHDDDRSLA